MEIAQMVKRVPNPARIKNICNQMKKSQRHSGRHHENTREGEYFLQLINGRKGREAKAAGKRDQILLSKNL